MEPERDVWIRFISGDQEAYCALYTRYVDILYAFGLRYSPDKELIMDCIHDLFIDLHKYRPRLSEAENPRFYLLKSFRRKLARASQRNVFISFDTWFSRMDPIAIDAFTLSPDHQLMADEANRQLMEALTRELNLLPPRQREIIFLKFKYDLTYEEIAAMLQITIPTCRTLIYRSLKKLRSRIDRLDVIYSLLILSTLKKIF